MGTAQSLAQARAWGRGQGRAGEAHAVEELLGEAEVLHSADCRGLRCYFMPSRLGRVVIVRELCTIGRLNCKHAP